MTNRYLVSLLFCGVFSFGSALSGCHRAGYSFQTNSHPPQHASAAQTASSAALREPELPESIGTNPSKARDVGLPVFRHRLRLRGEPVVRKVAQRSNALKAADMGPLRLAEKHRTQGRAGFSHLTGPEPVPHRSKGVAFMLALLLGFTGAHLFYLGDRKPALTYLLTMLAGVALLTIAIPVANSAAFGAGIGGAFVGVFLIVAGAGAIAYVYLRALYDAVRILAGGLEPVKGKF